MINFKYKKIEKGSALAMALVMVVVVSMILTSLLGYISSQISFSKDRVERERAFQIAEAGVYYYRWYLAHQISGKTAEQIKNFWETTGGGCPVGVCTDYEADLEDPESGVVIGRYKLEVTKPDLGSTIVMAKSTGWTYKKPSAQRTVQVRFRRPSWSENIVLANDNMRFGAGTVVSGKIHSNLGIRFEGEATNVVSSSLLSYDDPDHCEVEWTYTWDGSQWVRTCNFKKSEFGVHTHVGGNDDWQSLEASPSLIRSLPAVFQAGRQFPVANMSFTGVVSDISYMRTQAIAAGTKFDNTGEGRMIELKTDGTFDIYKVNTYDSSSKAILRFAGKRNSDGSGDDCDAYTTASGSNIQCRDKTSGTACYCPRSSWTGSLKLNYSIPNNGVIFVADNIWLKGSISNRRLSIVAAELDDETVVASSPDTRCSKDVYLGMTDLLYTNTDGKDILGIIAQDDVDIIRNSESDLEIDAALLAKDGRVGRESYSGIYKDSITINGSVATNSRYGFAYVGNNHWCNSCPDITAFQIGNGYCCRNLNFDNNLLYYPPPYFPTGTEYSIDQWDEL